MATNFNAIQGSAWNWLGRNFLPCSVEKEGREIEFVNGGDVFIVLVFLPSSLTDCACVHMCVCARECTWHVSMSLPRVKFFLALSYMHLRACMCAHVCVCITSHIRSLQEGNVSVMSLCQSLHEGGGEGGEISNQQVWTGPCVEETGVSRECVYTCLRHFPVHWCEPVCVSVTCMRASRRDAVGVEMPHRLLSFYKPSIISTFVRRGRNSITIRQGHVSARHASEPKCNNLLPPAKKVGAR